MEGCATSLRGEFVRMLIITPLYSFEYIIFPSLQIVSLSPSIDVLSIYIVTSFVRVGTICCITLYYPPPLPLFPVTFIIPLPCRVPFPVISVKFLTWCYILVLKVKLQFIVLPLFFGYRYIYFTIFNYHVYYWIIYSYDVLFTFAYTFIVETLGSCWTFAYLCVNKMREGVLMTVELLKIVTGQHLYRW